MVLILIIINILVYILPSVVNFGGFSSFVTFQSALAKDNMAIAEGEYYRLLTSSFLHADLMHLGINMFSLYSVGPFIISIPSFGLFGFSLIYFLSAISSSLTSYFFNPNLSVGASGAIFGLVGALLVYSLKTGQTGILANLMIIIALNVAIAFIPGSRLDNWGHLGGFVGGAGVGYLLLLMND